MNIEQINEEWAVDCNINRNDLTLETLRTANLHQKYLSMLMQAKGKLIKLSYDYKSLREIKNRYFRGEMTKAELEEKGWNQYQGIKPLKTEMAEKLDVDPDLVKIATRIEYMENVVFMLESILTAIKGRDWAIKNHIQWEQFKAGN